MALMDIDDFKRVNDTYGHAAGDAVIRAVAATIKGSMREGDPVFRWGGEEFLVLMPTANLDHARVRLEGLRRRVRDREIELKTDRRTTVTLSFGVKMYRPNEASESALDRADQALYKAEHTGRDRIVVLDQPG